MPIRRNQITLPKVPHSTPQHPSDDTKSHYQKYRTALCNTHQTTPNHTTKSAAQHSATPIRRHQNTLPKVPHSTLQHPSDDTKSHYQKCRTALRNTHQTTPNHTTNVHTYTATLIRRHQITLPKVPHSTPQHPSDDRVHTDSGIVMDACIQKKGDINGKAGEKGYT